MSELVDVYEAARLTGTDIRQIDHWVRKGLVVPAVQASRRGVSRKYDQAGIDAIRAAYAKLNCCPHCGGNIRKAWGRSAKARNFDRGPVEGGDVPFLAHQDYRMSDIKK